MQFSTLSLLLALGISTGISTRINYDGAKAMRIFVGKDVTPVMNVIKSLSLPIWKGLSADGIPNPNSLVDLVVPADKAEAVNQLRV
jgi:hypothetical protein